MILMREAGYLFMSQETLSQAARTSREHLFGHLPLNLFRLLGGKGTQQFYAELLEHLETDVFAWSATVVPQSDAMDAIREFIDRKGRGVPIEEDAGDHPEILSENRAAIAYRRLIETGWLVEHRDRYRRLVDFNGYARVILQLLLDIKGGKARSYGAEVLTILASLETAIREPAERSQNVRGAAQAAKSFLTHLRSVASAIRTLEQEMSAQFRIDVLFKSFFEQFITEHLIEDFKRLHTQANPFRFAVKIVDACSSILGEPLLLDDLAEGYVREMRAPDLSTARQIIEDEVQSVLRIVDAFNDHLAIIEQITRRLETRIRNTVRHMDRITEADASGAVAALQALGRVPLERVPIGPMPWFRDVPAMGTDNFHQASRRRGPVARGVLRRPTIDPAFAAFREDVARHRDRMTLTPAKIMAYLAQAMDGRIAADAADLPLETLDDFIVFERLPLLRWLGGDIVAGRFEVELLSGERFVSEWLSCHNFRIRRLRAIEGIHA